MWGHSRHGLTKDDLLFFAIAAVLILAVRATAWIALDVGISSLFSNRTSVMEGEVSPEMVTSTSRVEARATSPNSHIEDPCLGLKCP